MTQKTLVKSQRKISRAGPSGRFRVIPNPFQSPGSSSLRCRTAWLRLSKLKAKVAGSEPTDPTVSVGVQGVNTRKVLGDQPAGFCCANSSSTHLQRYGDYEQEVKITSRKTPHGVSELKVGMQEDGRGGGFHPYMTTVKINQVPIPSENFNGVWGISRRRDACVVKGAAVVPVPESECL